MNRYSLFLFGLWLLVGGCRKFLDEKPDKSLVVPATLADLQALLDNNSFINLAPKGIGEASADNYYLTDADWAALPELDRSAYLWGEELFQDQYPNEWAYYYRAVYHANLALETLPQVERTPRNAAHWDAVKGTALFLRAQSLHKLAVNWAPAYEAATAATDLGVPLRGHTDFTETSVRASVAQTYGQVLTDLEAAVPLLPEVVPHPMRPSRAAAYALLARVHLSMRRYEAAGSYADSALALKSSLLDFSKLNAGANFPVPAFNEEVLFHYGSTPTLLSNTRAKVDSVLYASYGANDLRKTVFFRASTGGSYAFKGSYTGSTTLFMGLATDELYLTKAESAARAGKTAEALQALNTMLVTRWKPGTFTPYTAAGAAEALDIILEERRKELLLRDLRWMDLKRLNREGAGRVVRRRLNGQVYELAPNDPRYALPLPAYVINLTGMEQNPR